MRFLAALLLTSALAFVAGLYLPWWSVAIAAFGVALLVPQFLGRSFLSGFLGIFLFWCSLSLWIDVKNEHLLSQKIADLFHLAGSSLLLILITGLIGGLVGGLAAMSGSSLRRHP